MAPDKFGEPYGSSWEGMSLGEGREVLRGWPGECPDSPDPEGRHNCVIVSNVQSVEHFVCKTCGWEMYD
jgi:hypothetical protein